LLIPIIARVDGSVRRVDDVEHGPDEPDQKKGAGKLDRESGSWLESCVVA
jgi:hypothetical protein